MQDGGPLWPGYVPPEMATARSAVSFSLSGEAGTSGPGAGEPASDGRGARGRTGNRGPHDVDVVGESSGVRARGRKRRGAQEPPSSPPQRPLARQHSAPQTPDAPGRSFRSTITPGSASRKSTVSPALHADMRGLAQELASATAVLTIEVCACAFMGCVRHCACSC